MTLFTSESISASDKIPRAGFSPIPSCEARKLKKVVLSEGNVSVFAQVDNVRASPVWKVWRVSGGRAKL